MPSLRFDPPDRVDESTVVRWARRLLARRWWAVLAAFTCALLVASGPRYLTLDKSYRAYFDKDDPSLLNYDALQDSYTAAGKRKNLR